MSFDNGRTTVRPYKSLFVKCYIFSSVGTEKFLRWN